MLGRFTGGNRRRSFAAVLAASAVVVGAAGCGSSDSASNEEEFKIGVISTLSGPVASIGEVYKQAAEMWAEENPTIDGRKVTLIFKDDKGTTEGGVAAARSLVDREGVEAISGPFLSGVTSGVLPILTKSKVFSVNLSSLPDAANPTSSPYSVQIEFQKRLEAPSTVNAVAAAGSSKLGMLVVDNPLGQTTVDTIEATLESSNPGNIEVVGVEKFASGATDVTAQLRKLKDAGADALVIQAVGVPDYAVALKAVNELGIPGPIFGNSALAQPALADSVPAEVLSRARASGFTASVLNGTMTPEIEDFRSRLLEFSEKSTLDFFVYLAANSYDSLGIIKGAAEGAGSTDAQEMVDELISNGYDGLRLTYNFSEDDHLGLTAEDVAWGVGGTFENGAVASDPNL